MTTKFYDFQRLIKKYSNLITVTSYSGGTFVDGKYVKGEATTIKTRGVVVPLSQRKLYRSGGTLKTTDRQLYMLEPLPEPLEGTQVSYCGRTYEVEEETDYRDYADAYLYVLRWVEDK